MAPGIDELYLALCRLPAYIVSRFKCVAKPINFSAEQPFCSDQARHMLSIGDQHFFTIRDTLQSVSLSVRMYHLCDDGPSLGVPPDFLDFLYRTGRILASWNGLIVVRCNFEKKPPGLIICNPITGSWAPISSPVAEYQDPDGLYPDGVDMHIIIIPPKTPTSGEYKLLSVEPRAPYEPEYVLKEYNREADTWQVLNNNLNLGARAMRLEEPAVVNNCICFISDNYDYVGGVILEFPLPYVIKYSLDDEQSSLIQLPSAAVEDFVLGVYGVFKLGSRWVSKESLCLVRYVKSHFILWSLAECTSSWDQIIRINLASVIPMPLGAHPEMRGFSIVNGDCLIFAANDMIWGYNIHGTYEWRCRMIGRHVGTAYLKFIQYSSTLRPTGLPHQPSPFKEFLAAN